MRNLMLVFVLLVSSLAFAAEAPAPAAPPKPEAAAVVPAAPAVAAPAPAVAPVPTKTPVVEPSKAVMSALDANKDRKVDKVETAAATNADPTPAEVVAEIASLIEAARELKNKDLPRTLAITVFLGALFKLLLSLLKVLGKNLAWFKTQEGKRVLKYSTLALGAVAGLCANLGFGMNWVEALTIMLSGPLAVAIHEYTSDSKPGPAEPVKV
jgi:hypothetical protein